jgi:vacuolar iron transporter family protein
MMGRSRPARRYRRYHDEERSSAALYRAMAERSHGETRDILHGLADAEDRHADHWVRKLEQLGEAPSARRRRRPRRGGVLGFMARRFGVRAVIPLLERREAAEISRYDGEPGATDRMIVDERVHARIIASLFPSWRTRTSGSLRAATFGVNDGLVSNLALVMGVAGGQAADSTILLAGLAGLLGGGLSMGIGEWISVTSQRELWEGEVELDAAELDALPEEGANELALLLRAKGMGQQEAEEAAEQLLTDPQVAAQVLASEKLGFDPQALGSPWGAALSNFSAFVVGALIPVLPYIVASGTGAFVGAIVAAAAALFCVGALISLLTYRPLVLAGARQLGIGILAAAVTYVIGGLVGGVVG